MESRVCTKQLWLNNKLGMYCKRRLPRSKTDSFINFNSDFVLSCETRKRMEQSNPQLTFHDTQTLLFIFQPSTWHIGWQQSVCSLLPPFIKSGEAMSYNLTPQKFLPSVFGFISKKSLFRVCSCTLPNSFPSIFSRSGLGVCNLLNPTKACVRTFHFATPGTLDTVERKKWIFVLPINKLACFPHRLWLTTYRWLCFSSMFGVWSELMLQMDWKRVDWFSFPKF